MNQSLEALDPQIRRFIVDVCEQGARLRADGGDNSWPQRRRIAAQARLPWRQGGPVMAHVEDIGFDGPHAPFSLRIYSPAGAAATSPALVYLHGGGWCMFSVDTHDRLLREYAQASGLPVLAIDYSLAPEHPYPVALEQILSVLDWLKRQGLAHGIDSDRLALGGDSAGANLAVAAALCLRQAGEGSRLHALVLNYGAWSPVLSDQARKALGTADDMLSAAEMDEFWHEYLGPEATQVAGPLSAPLLANLQGLPPSLMLWGDRDVLGEQNAHMAQRLAEAGVHVREQIYPGAPHSFIEAMAISAQAQDAIGLGADWISQHLTVSNRDNDA